MKKCKKMISLCLSLCFWGPRPLRVLLQRRPLRQAEAIIDWGRQCRPEYHSRRRPSGAAAQRRAGTAGRRRIDRGRRGRRRRRRHDRRTGDPAAHGGFACPFSRPAPRRNGRTDLCDEKWSIRAIPRPGRDRRPAQLFPALSTTRPSTSIPIWRPRPGRVTTT